MTQPVQPKVHYFGERKENEPSCIENIGKRVLNFTGGTALLALGVTALAATVAASVFSFIAFASGVGIVIGIVAVVVSLGTGALSTFAFSKSVDCFLTTFNCF